MNKTVNMAVIGAGRIGKLHAEHLAYRIPGAKLKGIADINKKAAEECGQQLHVDLITDSYQKLLDDPAIDAVVVCSATNTHAKIIEESAAAGKHIFCEKPVDHELSKIDSALAAVKKAGVKLQIGFNRRFDPNFREIWQQLRQGAIGKPEVLRITSRDPAPPPIEYIKVSGGLFLDMAIHDFDMARYLMDSEVVSLYAVGAAMVDPEIGKAGDIDTAVVILNFANGAVGTIDNSRRAAYGYDQRVEVFGSSGVIYADNNTAHRTVLGDSKGMHAPRPLNFFMDRYIESYIYELKEFVNCILHDTDPPVSGDDGRRPVLMAMAAQKSHLEKRLVELAEIEKQTAIQR